MALLGYWIDILGMCCSLKLLIATWFILGQDKHFSASQNQEVHCVLRLSTQTCWDYYLVFPLDNVTLCGQSCSTVPVLMISGEQICYIAGQPSVMFLQL